MSTSTQDHAKDLAAGLPLDLEDTISGYGFPDRFYGLSSMVVTEAHSGEVLCYSSDNTLFDCGTGEKNSNSSLFIIIGAASAGFICLGVGLAALVWLCCKKPEADGKSHRNTMLELAMSRSSRVPISKAHAISEEVESSKTKISNHNWDTHLFGMSSSSNMSDQATVEEDEDLDPNMMRVSSALLAEHESSQSVARDNDLSRSHTAPN